MKFFALFILLICIDYAFLDCVLQTDGMDVEKSECLKRKVGENEDSEESTHTPDTCCLITTSGKLGDQTVVKSYCAALEKGKAADLEKERNEKYANLGTTKIECEESAVSTTSPASSSKSSKSSKSSNSANSANSAKIIQSGFIMSFLLLLL